MLLMVALMTVGVCQKAQAIEDPNPKGTMILGIRAGVVPGFGANVVGDYTLVDSWWKGHFTVGGYVGYNNRSYHWSGYTSHYSNFAIMPRATYGLNLTKEFEVHVGVMTGLTFQLDRWVYDSPSVSNDSYSHYYFTHAELVGARYMFNEKFGAEAEIVYSGYMSYFNAGVTIKL